MFNIFYHFHSDWNQCTYFNVQYLNTLKFDFFSHAAVNFSIKKELTKSRDKEIIHLQSFQISPVDGQCPEFNCFTWMKWKSAWKYGPNICSRRKNLLFVTFFFISCKSSWYCFIFRPGLICTQSRIAHIQAKLQCKPLSKMWMKFAFIGEYYTYDMLKGYFRIYSMRLH